MRLLIINFLRFTIIIPLTICAQTSDLPDSTEHSKSSRQKIRWAVPATLITMGTIAALDKDADEFFVNKIEIREERNEYLGTFSNHLDDYLQHAPSLTGFVLSLSGVKGRSDFANQVVLYAKSEAVMLVTVYSLKYSVGEVRPDTGHKNSFPSGHTAQAFVAATFLSKEYGQRNVWYIIGAYTAATTVGVFRVLNNRHWISDILVGAGIGILSTEIIYSTHQYRWGKNKFMNVAVAPFGNFDTKGLSLTIKL